MMQEQNFEPVRTYIQSLLGTKLQQSSQELKHIVQKRMLEHQIENSEEYLALIKSSEEERDQCISASTIKETYFYREPGYLNLLTRTLINSILRRKKSLTIISAGCSIGAEPYTIAMAIEETLGKEILSRCQIIGCDVDKQALRKARSGIYSSFTLRGLSDKRKSTYFNTLDNNLYEVKAPIRKAVEFLHINLLDANQIARLPLADILLYRNVSIYFDNQTRIQVFTSLAQRLDKQGALITGSAETLSHDFGILELASYEGLFYFKPHGMISHHVQPVMQVPPKPVLISRQATGKTKHTLKEVRALALAGEYAQALMIINQIEWDEKSLSFDGTSLKACVLYSLSRLEEARELSVMLVNKEALRMEGYLINAMILRLQNEDEQAQREFKKALYLDQDCWVAAYYIADVFQKLGEKQLARTFFSRVVDILQQKATTDSVLVLPIHRIDTKQILHLCRYAMDRL
ncbi:MAG: hypothetical protein EOM15_01555 [Spirochaetia bacterium]|nr:hypothetical protein [Spirochaetia bacterium]